jgi:hypothetical protein
MPVRFGVRAGFCARHWFHDRGPRRNASTCVESAANATHATNYERNSHETLLETEYATTQKHDGCHSNAKVLSPTSVQRLKRAFGPHLVTFAQRLAPAKLPSPLAAKNEEPPEGGSCHCRNSHRALARYEAADQPPILAVPERPSFRTQCTVEPSRVSL